MDNHHSHSNEDTNVLEHHHTVLDEIFCHLPFAIFSVAFAMICLSLFSYSSSPSETSTLTYRLFHNFHYLHLLFAATGTVLTFLRFSKNILLGIGVGFAVPAFFCTFSDAFLPYLGGKYVNLSMHFHWCFLSHLDVVLPFLIVGMINGWAMSNHRLNYQLFFSLGFHFIHILISSMASVLYLISFGFCDWWNHMGFVFIFLIIAVLIPCTFSDIIVPMLFARIKSHKH
ncbi:MAG: hypothetical protein WCT20_03370 [Candidatus Babeliales bacterium]